MLTSVAAQAVITLEPVVVDAVVVLDPEVLDPDVLPYSIVVDGTEADSGVRPPGLLGLDELTTM